MGALSSRLSINNKCCSLLDPKGKPYGHPVLNVDNLADYTYVGHQRGWTRIVMAAWRVCIVDLLKHGEQAWPIRKAGKRIWNSRLICGR